MTSQADRINRQELQDFYKENAPARAVLDHFASRERNRNTTTLDRLLVSLSEAGIVISRGDLIKVLRRLEEMNCGKLIAGRKGHPSRFVWAVGMVEVGRVAAGSAVTIEPAPPTETEEEATESDDDLLEHHFRLRKDLDVPLRLPADLSTTEAARLAAFIQTLPFDAKQA
jgi:hypothetical protein